MLKLSISIVSLIIKTLTVFPEHRGYDRIISS